jgi:hypothetical protein
MTSEVRGITMQDEFLNSEQLAKRWNMSSATLNVWRARGTGCKYKLISNIAMYALKDVEVYESKYWYIKPDGRKRKLKNG